MVRIPVIPMNVATTLKIPSTGTLDKNEVGKVTEFR